MADESWIAYGSRLTGELAAKLFLNGVMPGLGSLVDFTQAAWDCCNGNYAGAGVNVLSGVVEIGTAGISSTWKGFAKESGKKAVIQAAKEKAKTDGKKMVGKQVTKGLEKGVVEQTVNEVFSADTKVTLNNMAQSVGLSLISSGGREVGKTVFEDTFQYLGGSALEHILKGGVKKNAQTFSCEWMKEAAKRAAEEEYPKYRARKRALEFGGAACKGWINYSFNAPSQAFEREPRNTLSNCAPHEVWKSCHSTEGLNLPEQSHNSLSGTLEREPVTFSLNPLSNYAPNESWKSFQSTQSFNFQEQIHNYSPGTLKREPVTFSLNPLSNYAPNESWKSFQSTQSLTHNFLSFP